MTSSTRVGEAMGEAPAVSVRPTGGVGGRQRPSVTISATGSLNLNFLKARRSSSDVGEAVRLLKSVGWTTVRRAAPGLLHVWDAPHKRVNSL